jgi:hypothetical protein
VNIPYGVLQAWDLRHQCHREAFAEIPL